VNRSNPYPNCDTKQGVHISKGGTGIYERGEGTEKLGGYNNRGT